MNKEEAIEIEIINQIGEPHIDGYTVKEPLGVLLVDMPERPLLKYSFLELPCDKFVIDDTDDIDIVLSLAYRMTESEAKEKYPNFKWVSLEELENGL